MSDADVNNDSRKFANSMATRKRDALGRDGTGWTHEQREFVCTTTRPWWNWSLWGGGEMRLHRTGAEQMSDADVGDDLCPIVDGTYSAIFTPRHNLIDEF